MRHEVSAGVDLSGSLTELNERGVGAVRVQ
jgi:hypothetical protein